MWKKAICSTLLGLSMLGLPAYGTTAFAGSYPIGAEADGSGEVNPAAVAQAVRNCTLMEGVIRMNAFPCRVLATTYKDGDAYAASLVQKDDSRELWLLGVDLTGDDKVAGFEAGLDLYNFYTRVQNGKWEDLLICNITFFKDDKDADEKLGVWDGPDHMVPFYLFYKVQDGNPYNMVKVDGKTMTSAEGTLLPMHYQAPVKSRKRIRFVQEFLQRIAPLHDNVNEMVNAEKIAMPF